MRVTPETPLDKASTDDLLNELLSRFDTAMFAGENMIKQGDVTKYPWTFRAIGSKRWRLGVWKEFLDWMKNA